MNNSRLIFLGDAALARGFHLAGFEVFPDADINTLEKLLLDLRNKRASAFIILSQDLADSDNSVLREVREEGGRILISAVPPLNQPEAMHSEIDSSIAQLMGGGRKCDD